jgi:signal transduction histidine kinase
MRTNKTKRPFEEPDISVEELSIALYHANQKIMAINQQLKESEQHRLEMFSNLSHDLRSPIATIKSSIEYLQSFDHLDEKEVFSTLHLMNTKIQSIDYLMNQLFTITTLDSTVEENLNFEPIQMGMFLEDFFYNCAADTKYTERQLILKVPTHFPYYSSIDPKMIFRALDNLFTNALKYSVANDVIILDAWCNHDEIIISITDTGIGIAPENLSKIFQRTYMVSNARTPETLKGCGLGLSIVKTIVLKHNGRIWCESKLGNGSVFYIALPLLKDDTL